MTASVEARGIFVDALGLRDAPPVLLSLLVDDDLEQVVTDPDFGDAALAKELRVRSFADEMRDLTLRCTRESRCLFGFGPGHAWARWTPDVRALPGLYEDVSELALLWHHKADRPGTERWTLADFLDDLGEPLPGRLSARHTTSRLRHVQAQLRAHGAWMHLTGTAKGKWTKVLQQGEAEVRGLRTLALAAAAGLAA